MDNIKHKPGGGDKKIFDDKNYLPQASPSIRKINSSGSQVHSVHHIFNTN